VRRREASSTRFLDVVDAWVRLDLNTPEDYASARASIEG
jgi:CTP:molybdopterin cytidylyltransferase MocA